MKNYLLLYLVLIAATGWSQMVKPFTVNSTGGTAMIAGNVYDWSFGEMVMISTSASASLIVTAGLLQPIDPNVGTPEPVNAGMLLNAYPNPSSDQLFLECILNEEVYLDFQLFDMTGRILYQQSGEKATGNQVFTIPMESCPPGEYLLRSLLTNFSGKQYLKTFKIQKIQ
jgi:hypothetical protein